MPIAVGSIKLGPDNARLLVRTLKGGAAAKAGHNLLIEVTSWSATLELGKEQPRVELHADSGSLKVIEGTGGMGTLDDGDKAGIAQTIDEEILHRRPITFRSDRVEGGADGGELQVAGELELAQRTAPITFTLRVRDGRLTGSATVKQTTWGIKPYSALFGTLKVVDEVTVEFEAELPDGAGQSR